MAKTQYEKDYDALVQRIMDSGEVREGRNGKTLAVFGERLIIDPADHEEDYFPLLRGRKLFYKGVLGELAAFLRGPKCIEDFKKWDCNYWDTWGGYEGKMNIDYGNAWIDWGSYSNSPSIPHVNQLADLITGLKDDPYGRRHIISGWNPEHTHSGVKSYAKLDLPCCHLLYQWYVSNDGRLDMVWYQRSCDTMIGLPSDVILAFVWNQLIARETGLTPGRIIMDLGDTHLYEEHWLGIRQYQKQSGQSTNEIVGAEETKAPKIKWLKACDTLPSVVDFEPGHIQVEDYNPQPTIKFLLKE